jgi:hypothetical protein
MIHQLEFHPVIGIIPGIDPFFPADEIDGKNIYKYDYHEEKEIFFGHETYYTLILFRSQFFYT